MEKGEDRSIFSGIGQLRELVSPLQKTHLKKVCPFEGRAKFSSSTSVMFVSIFMMHLRRRRPDHLFSSIKGVWHRGRKRNTPHLPLCTNWWEDGMVYFCRTREKVQVGKTDVGVSCLWGSLRQCMLKRQCTDLPASSTGGCRSSNLIHTTVTTLRSSTATASASAASAAASGPPPNHPSARLRSSLFASAQGSETVRGKIMSAQYTHSGEAKK